MENTENSPLMASTSNGSTLKMTRNMSNTNTVQPISYDGSGGDGDQDSENSCDENNENVHKNKESNMNVSFYKVNLDDHKPEEMIEIIQKRFTGNKQNKNKNPYEEKDISEYLITKEYKAKAFVQVTKGKSAFTKLTDKTISTQNVNCVLFLYSEKVKEHPAVLYAVTFRHGRQLISWCVDEKFSENIGTRIASPKGCITVTENYLFGNKRRTTNHFAGDNGLSPSSVGSQIEEYTAKIRSESSILKLPCFTEFACSDDELPPTKKRKVNFKVTISHWRVRFLISLKGSDFEPIILALNAISAGETNDLVIKSLLFKKNAIIINEETSEMLNKEMCRILCSNLERQSTPARAHGLSLCASRTVDFLHSNDLQFQYGQHVRQFPSPPSLDDAIKEFHDVLCKSKNSEGLQKKMSSFLNGCRFKFTGSDGNPTSGPFMKLIEGYMMYNDTVYWRVRGKWVYFTNEYMMETQKKFVEILENHLIRPRDELDLGEPWQSVLKNKKVGAEVESAFNNRYNNRKGFLVGDEIFYNISTPQKIELFDILKYNEEKSSALYHVKNGFDGGALRAVCSQIFNSTAVLKNAVDGNSAEFNIFEDWITNWKKKFESSQTQMPFCMESGKSFKRVLHNPFIVCTLNPSETKSLSVDDQMKQVGSKSETHQIRSLHLEKQVLFRVTRNRLAMIIKAKGLEDDFWHQMKDKATTTSASLDELADIIFKGLVNGEFIDEEGDVLINLMYKTFKYFEEQAKTKKLFRTTHAPTIRKIFNEVLEIYRTRFHSLGAKVDLIRMLDNLVNNMNVPVSKVKICEIRFNNIHG